MDVDLSNILKRCLSAPTINNFSITKSKIKFSKESQQSRDMTSAAPPQTNTNTSKDVSPAPILNIFTPRARRYSASFASLGAQAGSGPRLTPRVSQLRQEECIDMNSREVNHEREVHSAMQISQSWEDLTLVTENWSCKSDDLTHPLQVTLPSGLSSCSSPSPTSRTGVRLPYGLSPSPTRRTFATRRSMSPIAMRPSQLGPVKRKFELDDSNWTNSPPPLKKFFTESRGSSPICQSPSSICPSPDSGTYEGRITPKLFVTKCYTNNINSTSSIYSSTMVPSPMMDTSIELRNNDSSPANTISSTNSEPMHIGISEDDTDSGNHEVEHSKLLKLKHTKGQIEMMQTQESDNKTNNIHIIKNNKNQHLLSNNVMTGLTEYCSNFIENSPINGNTSLNDRSLTFIEKKSKENDEQMVKSSCVL